MTQAMPHSSNDAEFHGLGPGTHEMKTRFPLRRRTVRTGLLSALVLPICWSVSITESLGQETSVRPGINESFETPDVEQFVERFEKEGREVYDQREAIIEACRLEPGMVVADIGAGTGLFTRLLAGQVGADGKVYAVDIAEEFVEHVVQGAKEAGLENVEGVVCEPDFVNLPPASVDVVFICDTYHHFEFPYKTMASLHRALKPGGRVVLVEFARIDGVSSEWIMGHVRAGEEVFTREIEESGFRRVDELAGVFKESYLIRFEKFVNDDRPDTDRNSDRSK